MTCATLARILVRSQRSFGEYDRALSDEDGSTFVERDDVDWLDDFELTKDDLADGK